MLLDEDNHCWQAAFHVTSRHTDHKCHDDRLEVLGFSSFCDTLCLHWLLFHMIPGKEMPSSISEHVTRGSHH